MTDTPEPVSTLELRALNADLDSLMKRADVFRGMPERSYVGVDEVFAHLDLMHKLAEAKNGLDKLAQAINADIEHTKAPIRMCLCKEIDDHYDNTDCPIHLVDHVYEISCCDQPEKTHRHMTDKEFEVRFPLLFDHTFEIGDQKYRVDARQWREHIGVTFTRLFKHRCPEDRPCEDAHDDESESGLCFDFDAKAVPQLIETLAAAYVTLPL